MIARSHGTTISPGGTPRRPSRPGQPESRARELAPEQAPGAKPRRWLPKVFTLVAMGVAVVFSVYEESVLVMVLLAWSILACGFGPLVIWRSFGLELSPLRIVLIAGVGLGLLFGWPYLDLGKRLAAMAPAFLGALGVGGALYWRQGRGPQAPASEVEPKSG